MQRSSVVIVTVGIFFVVGVVLLFMFSLKTGGHQVVGGYDLYTEVVDSRGLEKGAEVLLAGVPVGVVDRISLTDDKNRVRIRMSVSRQTQVREDAVASIQLKSLLGNYYVHLSHGSPSAPPAAPRTVLKSAEVVDINEVMRVLSGMGDEVDGLVASFKKNEETFFAKVNGMVDENRGNVKKVTDALAKSAPKVETFFDAVSTVSQSLSAGKGTLGKLFTSDEVYDHVRVASANLRDVSEHVRKGEGTIGRLVYDQKMSSQLAETIDNVSSASRSVKNFMDTNMKDVNELVKTLREASPNVKAAVNNFLQVSEKINNGKGTLGKLVNDPELYDEARRAISQIRKTFEEGEEQSVMRTFLGVFFGSMI